MRVFHQLSTTNWPRFGIILAAATAFWIGLATVIPEKYHHVGIVILGAAQSAVTLLMKSGQSPQQEVKEAVESITEKKQEIKQAENAIKEIGKP